MSSGLRNTNKEAILSMSNTLGTPKRMLSYFSRISLAVLACRLALVYGNPAPGAETVASALSYASGNQWNSAFLSYGTLPPDGNRLVPGSGSLPHSKYVDIPLSIQPVWLAAAPIDGDTVWVVSSDEGRIEAFRVAGDIAKATVIRPNRLPPGMPPLLRVENGVPELVTVPEPDASALTHAIILNGSRRLAFVETDGDLVVWDDGVARRLPVNALPDARLLTNEAGRVLLLTGATTRYSHGVLGDTIESGSITLIDVSNKPEVIRTISLPDESVVEGIAPIWTDITGDGVREIIVTLSDARQGARVVVFSETGEIVAEGPAIGRGYRWRHPLVVVPFGPGGELELVDVLTPHLGGVVEFYRLEGKTLRVVAQMRGYTSHVIGSRNLDMAAAGDFDGDGRLEILLPNQRLTELGAVRRTATGVEIAWSVSLGGRLRTNLAAVTLSNGTLAIGAGREGKVLRIWLPE